MVLFATPGMLHGGFSLQVFKEWCTDPANTIIIPGYCVAGTIGNLLLKGNRKFVLDGVEIEVKMTVKSLSFSAHADAKGILNLIENLEPKAVMLVHGEKSKMIEFAKIVESQIKVPCFYPANFERVILKDGEIAIPPIPENLKGMKKIPGYLLEFPGKKCFSFNEEGVFKDLEKTMELMKGGWKYHQFSIGEGRIMDLSEQILCKYTIEGVVQELSMIEDLKKYFEMVLKKRIDIDSQNIISNLKLEFIEKKLLLNLSPSINVYF